MKQWKTKFELKPDRWVFVPTAECVEVGREIQHAVSQRWIPPPYYYHLQRGGHVAAARAHIGHSQLVRLDIEDFFGSVGLSRLTRSLKARFGYPQARTWAKASVVRHPTTGALILPFGFVQSQILASMCLHDSALGGTLRRLSRDPSFRISVYVDDIILSAENAAQCAEALALIEEAAASSHFRLSAAKRQGPSDRITAFNIEVGLNTLAISPARLAAFKNRMKAVDPVARQAIVGYVNTVNASQADGLSQGASVD
jgi:hypothetical protein